MVAAALRDEDDAESATGEYAVVDGDGPSHLGELAPWENVTPSSMNFEHGGPIHLESAPYRIPASARENAGALRWAAVLALGVAVGVIALLLALTGSDNPPTTAAATTTGPAPTTAPATTVETEANTGTTATGPAATALEVQTALTFDPPPGDGSENDDQAQQAIDGDAATFWETELYRSDPVLSKGGVGLVLALPQRAQVAAVELRTPAPGFTAGIYTSALAAPPVADGWDIAAPPREITRTRQRIAFAKPARARFILVWITRLAPAEGSELLGPDRRGPATRIVT